MEESIEHLEEIVGGTVALMLIAAGLLAVVKKSFEDAARLDRQLRPHVFELLTSLQVVGHHLCEFAPVRIGVVSHLQVEHLVDHNVVDQRWLRHDDAPIEPDGSVRGAAAPNPMLPSNQDILG